MQMISLVLVLISLHRCPAYMVELNWTGNAFASDVFRHLDQDVDADAEDVVEDAVDSVVDTMADVAEVDAMAAVVDTVVIITIVAL